MSEISTTVDHRWSLMELFVVSHFLYQSYTTAPVLALRIILDRRFWGVEENGNQRGFVPSARDPLSGCTEGLVSSPETSRRHGVRQELPDSAFIWAGIMPKRVGIPNMMECQPVLAWCQPKWKPSLMAQVGWLAKKPPTSRPWHSWCTMAWSTFPSDSRQEVTVNLTCPRSMESRHGVPALWQVLMGADSPVNWSWSVPRSTAKSLTMLWRGLWPQLQTASSKWRWSIAACALTPGAERGSHVWHSRRNWAS